MSNTKKTVIFTTAGALALGAGIGIAGLASADPTTSPSPSASATQTGSPTDRPMDGPGRHGPRDNDLAQQLADKLDVTQAKVSTALQEIREANRPTTKPTPGTRPDRDADDAALAKALADKLGLDEAKVKTALAEIRSAEDAERTQELDARLAAAVKAGTLTQAEADAVKKAVEKGVIGPH